MTKDQDEWLKKNTFYCERLRCFMSEEQCRINRSLYAEWEKIPLDVWMDAPSGMKKLLANQRRPPGCDHCPKRKKG